MFHRSRILLAIALVATATAGYAALQWKTWRPADACLLCDASPDDSGAGRAATGGAPTGTGGSLGTESGSSAGAFVPGDLSAPGSKSADDSTKAPFARFGSAPRGWQPWGVGSGAFRVSSTGSSGPSAPLG